MAGNTHMPSPADNKHPWNTRKESTVIHNAMSHAWPTSVRRPQECNPVLLIDDMDNPIASCSEICDGSGEAASQAWG